MTAAGTVSFLVFEAAGCLMAVPASEIVLLEDTRSPELARQDRSRVDLDEYFEKKPSHGPWLRWVRGTRSAWLRVRRVVDVVPVSLSALAPMPRLLRRQSHSRAFLAAGLTGREVFLVLDPGRLKVDE